MTVTIYRKVGKKGTPHVVIEPGANRICLRNEIVDMIGCKWTLAELFYDDQKNIIGIKLCQDSSNYTLDLKLIETKDNKRPNYRLNCPGFVEQFGLSIERPSKFAVRYDETQRMVVIDLSKPRSG